MLLAADSSHSSSPGVLAAAVSSVALCATSGQTAFKPVTPRRY